MLLYTCPPSTPSVKITPKILAKIASLNSSIAFGDLRLGGCLQAPGLQAPARAQSPTRNTRIKRRKIRMDFWFFLDVPESEVYTLYPRITWHSECAMRRRPGWMEEFQANLILCTINTENSAKNSVNIK